ncbi:MAG: ABC-2 family transporter protein [Clostridia bacterium]|nr:ABC-2 family transporter protein [Clostridia bacterium]
MKRILKIYFRLLSQNIKMLMEYRIDFLTGAFSFIIDQVVGIGFIFIIFSQIPELAGYTLDQIVFIYGFSLIPKGLDHMFTDNLWSVGYFIVQKGDFDKYLTRPINPLFHIIAEKFQIDAAGELIMGIILVCISAGSAGVVFTPLSVVLLIVAIIFASLIYTSIKLGTAALAFWIKVSGQVTQVFYMTNEFAKYPTTIYSDFIRTVITYIVPFAFTGYYPCVYLFTGENPLFNIGGVVIVSSVLMMIALTIWNRGLKAYESAGS